MPEIHLKYGNSSIPFSYDENRFEILGKTGNMPLLSDAQIGEKLDDPIGSKTIEDIVNPGETILIVVPGRDTSNGLRTDRKRSRPPPYREWYRPV